MPECPGIVQKGMHLWLWHTYPKELGEGKVMVCAFCGRPKDA